MMNFDVNVAKILDIVINNVYTDKDIVSRELVSNASDACEKLRCLSLMDEEYSRFRDNIYKIQIEINKKEGFITIKDNGIGFSKDDLVRHLGTIANSGTGEFLSKLEEAKNNNKTDLIGQFGIGFYSSYLIADKVEVRTKHALENKYHIWVSDGKTGFTIEELEDFTSEFNTEIKLFVKDGEKDYLDKYKISNIVKTYSNYISFPVEIASIEEKSEENTLEVVNKRTAIWLKDKNDIKKEEYLEFYKSLSHDSGEPFEILHKKIEGEIEFRMLLFIPFKKSFDIFHPDRHTKVKLYIKKVFINEKDNDFIPKYLRFVFGVIDSNDLPFNLSRETIQNSSKMRIIKKKITNDILKSLRNKQKNHKEEYDKFWEDLGQVLKEGLCDGFEDRKALLDLVQFRTLKHQDKLISFEDYISQMKEDQKDILYLIADNFNDALNSPYLENPKAKDFDVIIFTDPVDSFCMGTLVYEVNGKNLTSVADMEFKLEEKKEENKEDDTKSINDEQEKDMIKLFEDALQKKVKKVIVSSKLIESPACISLDPGQMNPSMEDMLIQQGQLKERALKNLEINSRNPLIKKITEFLKSDNTKDKETGVKLANAVLGLAKISQGEFPKDKVNFSREILSLFENLV